MSRDFSLRLAGFGLGAGLLLAAATGTLAIVFGTPEHIKQAAVDSRLYNAANSLLGTETDASKQNPDVQPTIKSVASDALSPDKLRDMSEEVIDGTYNWLDGSSERPNFSIDLTPTVERFMAGIGDEAAKRAATLRPCTPTEIENLRNTDPQDINALALNCLPPGMTPELAREQAAAFARANSPLPENPVITADTLAGTSGGQSVFGPNSPLPVIYNAMMAGPWIAGILSIICLGLLFLLHTRPARAAYGAGRVLFSVGVAILMLGGLGHLVFSVMTSPGSTVGQMVAGSPQEYLLAFIRTLETITSRTFMTFGAVFAAAGGILIVALRMMAWHSLNNKTSDVAAARPPQPAKLAPVVTTHHKPAVLPMAPAPVKLAKKSDEESITFGKRPDKPKDEETEKPPAPVPAGGPVIAPTDPNAALDKQK